MARQGSGGFGSSRDCRAATIFASGSGAAGSVLSIQWMLSQSRQVGGRPLCAISDDDRKQDESVIPYLAVASFVVLDLLPVAEPVRDKDQNACAFATASNNAGCQRWP